MEIIREIHLGREIHNTDLKALAKTQEGDGGYGAVNSHNNPLERRTTSHNNALELRAEPA